MLLSMTGYGRVANAYEDKTITVEIRSLNSKFTDVRLKIPQNYKEKEAEIRKLMADKAERGKLDVNIDVSSHQGVEAYGLNKALFKKYYKELNSLAAEIGMENENMLQAILKLPNVVATAENELSAEEWNAVTSTINDALSNFYNFRLTEGSAMEADLRIRIEKITELLSQLDPFEADRVQSLRQRLKQNLEEYVKKEKVDENRFEQEIIYYLEKIDITEEKVRLQQHCKYFIEVLDKESTLKGRKLSFISQEMGREINTMGAKAYSSNIQRLVVGMKDELEKIKEQVANSV
jgi:uncharacterized protein (TIGR00255 family)